MIASRHFVLKLRRASHGRRDAMIASRRLVFTLLRARQGRRDAMVAVRDAMGCVTGRGLRYGARAVTHGCVSGRGLRHKSNASRGNQHTRRDNTCKGSCVWVVTAGVLPYDLF